MSDLNNIDIANVILEWLHEQKLDWNNKFEIILSIQNNVSVQSYMIKQLLQQRFFRLLSEYSQRKVSASELTEAIEELATHVANFSINKQDYSVLLRYFSFGLHRLKSYRTRFEQEKNTLFVFNRWSDRTFKHRNTPYRMAHQVSGTTQTTAWKTKHFPSLSRW